MTSLFLFWIGVGIGFLIIEMITVTFYGLSISLASFVTALYVWYTGILDVNIVQGIIFVLVTLVTSYFLPKLLTPKGEQKAQGLDTYFGEIRHVKKVGEDYKIVLDGIDYILDVD